MLLELKKKYIGDKAFYHRYISLALPMIFQNFIMNFVNFLDNIMVGRLGTEPMTGVAIVNQLYFVYALALFGISAAGSIFGAQFYGKADHQGHMYTFRFRIYATILVSVICFLILLLHGETLVTLYLNESASEGDVQLTLDYAMRYLRIVLIGFAPYTLATAYVSTIRETGQTFVPMVSGMIAVATNAVLDYLLIFGIGFFPRLGVEGAAAATVIARFVECAIILTWAHRHSEENRFLKGAYTGLGLPSQLTGKILAKGLPLFVNELLWSMGMTLLTQCYSVRGLEVVAGLNIASTISNLFNIVFIQLGACISIIVGQYLGAGELEKAKDADNKMIFFSVACCCGMALLMLLVGRFFPLIYNTTDQIRGLATSFIYVLAVIMPFAALSHCFYFTLRSGGKTFVTFLFDSGFTWVIMVPCAFLLARFTGLGIVTVYLIVNATELIKNVLGYGMVRSNTWLNNIV